MTDKTDVAERIEKLFADTLREQGRDLRKSTAEVAHYLAERSAVLAAGADEPGFERAVAMERNAALHFLEIEAIDQADAADARIIGLVQGVLTLGALALA